VQRNLKVSEQVVLKGFKIVYLFKVYLTMLSVVDYMASNEWMVNE
jgi:hypothetical protein